MAVSITKQARDLVVMETDTMTVALLREYGLPGARERARYHVGRCVEASLVDDAAFWMRVTNYLENLLSSDMIPPVTAARSHHATTRRH
ncbi:MULTISPECIES: hypothetical protein [Komagataeibacter]|uniref:hypothetical protein n=1 Tax=Komagataeibacter TaxID=1434011 RepID=UPI0002080922|nr:MULTISPECIES: hypothetical protein [Komagataeibacter]ARW18472.1 hypothetical protein S101446_03398 [Komagataeibacter europaeus]EGG78629.1 hypothetical protein SXCC_00610 [Gluconacetobacter sp. SXCC-1]